MEKYKIAIVDIYRSGFDNDMYFAKEEFNSYKAAKKFCQDFLDRDFSSIVKDCKNEKDFYNYWSFHGERLLIMPDSKNDSFNSNEYIEKKVKEYFKN